MGFDYATAATPILKEVYLPQVQELLPNSTPLLKQIEKEVTPVEGGNFVISIHRTRNSAAGIARAESGTLPTAGQQGYVRAIVPIKQLYSRISVTGKSIAATKSNKGSFVRAIDSEMQYVMKDTKRSLNRQVNGDGTGALAYFTGADDTSGTNLDDNFGNGTTHLGPGSIDVNIVDASSTDDTTLILNTSSSTLHTFSRGAVGTTSTAVTWSTGALSGTADGDYLVYPGTNGKEIVGLQAIVSADNPPTLAAGLHGLPVTTYPDWVATVLGSDSTRQDFSFTLLQQLFSRITTEGDVDSQDIKFIHTHPAMRDTYVKAAQDQRVFHNNMKLDGGWEVCTYNGKPWNDDVQCRRNAIYVLTPSSMKLMQMAPLDWMDKDGSIFYRLSGGDVDGYGATLFGYLELGCLVRNQNGVLLGINEVWA